MAVTRFCHLYILSYSKQELYKACTYVIKSSLPIDTEACKQCLEESRS
ncbi:hypothetical protein V6Z11_A08G086900 [Gossypium hirsutum]